MNATPLAGDRDLMVRARNGEAKAREELANRHRRAAYLLALQLTGNPDDALDLAQDAMLTLFTHLATIDDSLPIRPWLFTVVRNRTRDLWRRRKIRRAETLASEGRSSQEGPDAGHQIVDRSADPEERAAAVERRHRVWAALAALPAGSREILVLRDFHDLAYAEIANVLGIPMGTVMSRLHSARKKLREIYLRNERNRP